MTKVIASKLEPKRILTLECFPSGDALLWFTYPDSPERNAVSPVKADQIDRTIEELRLERV
jgi:hypothetical protein